MCFGGRPKSNRSRKPSNQRISDSDQCNYPHQVTLLRTDTIMQDRHEKALNQISVGSLFCPVLIHRPATPKPGKPLLHAASITAKTEIKQRRLAGFVTVNLSIFPVTVSY